MRLLFGTPHSRVNPLKLAGLVALSCVLLATLLVQLRRGGSPLAEVPRGALVLREGRLYLERHTVPFTGVMIEHYEDGGLKSRSSISKGLLEGPSEGWYLTGEKQVSERFHQGVSDGIRTKWYKNGQMLSRATVVQGKLHGAFRRWREDGSLSQEVQLIQGVPNGVSRAYYPSGCVQTEVMLRDGKVISRKSWRDGERPASALAENG